MDEAGIDELQAVIVPAADVERDGSGHPAVEDELAVVAEHGAGGVEGLGGAGRFHDHVTAAAAGQGLDLLDGILFAGVDHDIRAEGLGQVQLAFQDIDHDDLIGAFELGALGDDLPGIAGTHDDDGVAELHAGVEAGEHGAGGGLTERRDIHIQAFRDRLQLESFGLEIISEVVVPAEGHDLVADFVIGDLVAYRDDGAAALVAEKEGEFRFLAELGGLRGHEAAVEVLVGTADADHVVLDDDIVFFTDEFALDEFNVVRAVQAGCSCNEFLHDLPP